MYTPLLHIPTISQKLAEGQRSKPWWICQDKIRIVHPEVQVRLFHGVSFQGIDLSKKRLNKEMLMYCS